MTYKEFLFQKGITDSPDKSLFMIFDGQEFDLGQMMEEYHQAQVTDPTQIKALTVQAFNAYIQSNTLRGVLETNEISDGYHTFGELYAHRIALWIALCGQIKAHNYFPPYGEYPVVWRSLRHSHGELAFGGEWFLLGIGLLNGRQITYHLPIQHWPDCEFARTLERAPEWDGHTSADVLERIKQL